MSLCGKTLIKLFIIGTGDFAALSLTVSPHFLSKSTMALNDRLTGRIVVFVFVFCLVVVTLWHLLHSSEYNIYKFVPSPMYAFVITRYLFLSLSFVILCIMIYTCVNSQSRTWLFFRVGVWNKKDHQCFTSQKKAEENQSFIYLSSHLHKIGSTAVFWRVKL